MPDVSSSVSVPPVVRLTVVGGFLGAGKTTAILGLARRMLDQGLRIGIVTNDQGSNLVDTEVLRQNGLDVMEIAGGCFCCNFDQFSEKLAEMSRIHTPDVILAEPVGSCTDLVATVMKPLGQQRPGIPTLALSPLSVVVDPRRLRRVMREQPAGPGFSDEINYLFRKQLEEAEIIALNKCDLTDADEIAGMTAWLERQFPGVTVLAVSAARGDGMDGWTASLGSVRRFGARKSMDVAYDVYAAAEAELGWLNVRAEIAVSCASDPDGNALLRGLMERIRADIAADGQEIAHLKGYLVSGTDWAKMSCTGTTHPLVADNVMAATFEHASLVLNLRAAADPERLQALVTAALDSVFGGSERVRDVLMEAFRPSYPKPKNRMA